MATLKWNLFAPGDGDAPDEEQAMRADLEEHGLTVVSLEPAHQGSWDIVATGTRDIIQAYIDHIGEPQDAIIED